MLIIEVRIIEVRLYYSQRVWPWAYLIQLGKDVTILWVSKVATRGLFQFRNQLQPFTIRLHLINLHLCSAWAVIRFKFNKVLMWMQHGISFLRAKFRHANAIHSSSVEIIDLFKLQWNLRRSFHGLASHVALTFRRVWRMIQYTAKFSACTLAVKLFWLMVTSKRFVSSFGDNIFAGRLQKSANWTWYVLI